MCSPISHELRILIKKLLFWGKTVLLGSGSVPISIRQYRWPGISSLPLPTLLTSFYTQKAALRKNCIFYIFLCFITSNTLPTWQGMSQHFYYYISKAEQWNRLTCRAQLGVTMLTYCRLDLPQENSRLSGFTCKMGVLPNIVPPTRKTPASNLSYYIPNISNTNSPWLNKRNFSFSWRWH